MAAVAGAEEGVRGWICSATDAENKATLPRTVNRLRMRATTATGVVTFPGTARSRGRRGSSAATTAARPDMWPGTVNTPTSRSATPVVDLDTSRSSVTKSSVTGVVRSAMLLCNAARQAR